MPLDNGTKQFYDLKFLFSCHEVFKIVGRKQRYLTQEEISKVTNEENDSETSAIESETEIASDDDGEMDIIENIEEENNISESSDSENDIFEEEFSFWFSDKGFCVSKKF